jgi:hypothetical protein
MQEIHSDYLPIDISNAEFISAIFPEDTNVAVCSKRGDPTEGGWIAQKFNENVVLDSTTNNYVNCSSFQPEEDGTFNVQKKNFEALHFILLDDLGTKVPIERLGDFKPTWMIETSPGNFQVGIVLKEPITDIHEAGKLLKSILDAGYGDRGAGGVSRWARSSNAINGKEKHRDEEGNPFQCKLVVLNPEVRYTVQEIIDGLQLTLPKTDLGLRYDNEVYTPKATENPVIAALKEHGLYKMSLGSGKHDITCPWLHEHTNQLDSGTAYFEPDDNYDLGGFHCFHSHEYHIRDLLKFLALKGELHNIVDATKYARAKKSKGDRKKDNAIVEDVEPYSEAVDVEEVLDEIYNIILKYVVIDFEYAIALTLWIAFTYFTRVVETAPLLVVNAPDSSCGKSVVTAILKYVVARPLSVANSSMAFVYRSIELWEPTIIFDEIDTFMKANSEVIGVINAGYTRENAFVGRTVGENFEPKMFNAWSAKVLSGITVEKHLAKATMSRAIELKLRRKLQHEKVTDFRYEDKSPFKLVQAKLARMALDYSSHVQNVDLSLLPNGLSDREQDNWIYLLMIAQLGGDEWLDKAKKAALAMHANTEPQMSAGVEILSDIREIFAAHHEGKISSADVIGKLIEDTEAPWLTWNRGKPLGARQLAKLLEPYGIKTKNLKFGLYNTLKGFELAQFEDAFARYLAPADLCNDKPKPNYIGEYTVV